MNWSWKFIQTERVDEVAALVQDTMTRAFLELFKAYDPEPMGQNLVEVGIGPNYAAAK